jgi:site-specific DNA-methyltransferase (adenine-specific)
MNKFKTDLLDLRLCDNMELMAQYPDKHFELAIVDPPYGIGEDGLKNHSRGKATRPKLYKPKQWDRELSTKEYFIELQRVSKNQIIWGSNHFIQNIPNANSSCWIVWDKLNGENDFADCELALTSFKTAARKFDFRWAGMLQGDMKNKENRIHPTQKPVALYKWLLHNYAKEGHKILDTHLGSMSIAIACHDYGFHLTGCELDPDYFADGVKRVNSHIKQLSLF